jgi:hypothetical protein
MVSRESAARSVNASFAEAVRDADWDQALSVLKSADDPFSVQCSSSSPIARFIELNAPPHAVTECMREYAKSKHVEVDRLGLLELCIDLSNSKSNAFPTFKALLAAGMSPNVTVSSGDTLLQHAISLNRVLEVEELLRHGVDPHQMSVFGLESTSNIEGAKLAGNAAGDLAFSRLKVIT